jgi:hypothetical protein
LGVSTRLNHSIRPFTFVPATGPAQIFWHPTSDNRAPVVSSTSIRQSALLHFLHTNTVLLEMSVHHPLAWHRDFVGVFKTSPPGAAPELLNVRQYPEGTA